MSEKLKSTSENSIDTEAWHNVNNEKSTEITKSLEKAIEKEKSNAENENNIKHEAIELATRHENEQTEKRQSKEAKEDKPLTKKDIDNSKINYQPHLGHLVRLFIIQLLRKPVTPLAILLPALI